MIEIRHENMVKTINTKEAYDEIYASSGIQLKDSFYLWILNLLKISSNTNFLDVSCGYGRLVHFVNRKTKKVFGIDFSETAVKIAASLYPPIEFNLGDGEFLPYKSNTFDIVTNIGSIEHFQNPGKGIQEISRILKYDGLACILVPNGYSLLGNIKHVMMKGDIFDDGQPLQRYNTKNGWKRLLEQNGLIPIKVIAYERPFPRTWRDFIWYLYHPFKLTHMLVGYLIPKNLTNCFVYLCEKYHNEENN